MYLLLKGEEKMYNLYRKSPENFALSWIGIYCIIQSLSNGISNRIGIPKSANAVLALIQSAYLLWWLRKNGLMKAFCLQKPSQKAKNMLFYIPLILISVSNLWLGISNHLLPAALVFHILLMLCVGFLEELIFRGFLFEALREKNLKTAVTVSSLTFGAGHILNLFNGSGMSLGNVLFQILYAILVGFLFVEIYLRSGSLIPCILTHQAVNILSAFSSQQASQTQHLTVRVIEFILILFYLGILRKTAPIPESQVSR